MMERDVRQLVEDLEYNSNKFEAKATGYAAASVLTGYVTLKFSLASNDLIDDPTTLQSVVEAIPYSLTMIGVALSVLNAIASIKTSTEAKILQVATPNTDIRTVTTESPQSLFAKNSTSTHPRSKPEPGELPPDHDPWKPTP